MLIVTSRHTAADLRKWEEYEEVDDLILPSQKMVHESMNVISSWCKAWPGDACAYTSWGKDSVVMLHLLSMTGIRVPVVYVRYVGDRDNPDCELVRDRFLSTHDLDYHEESFVYEDVRATGAHWKASAAKYGRHRITGIRRDESKRRMKAWNIYGFSSANSCRPLSLWSSQKIFSYIHHEHLPLCPVYGYLGGGRWKRSNLRTHSLAGSSGNGMGRTEWEEEYYRDEINRVAAERQ